MSYARTCLGLCAAGWLMLTPAEGRAGAWTFPQGHGQVILTAMPSWAASVFGTRGRVLDGAATSKFELQLLIEYGVTDRFTAIVSPSVQHIAIDQPVNATRTGLGYSELGARYRFFSSGDWVVSGQALVRLPGTGDATNPAAIGYTGTEVDIRALLGKGFTIGSTPGYVDLQVAQRVRSDGPPDEFRADVTVGFKVYPQWLLLAQVFNVFSEGAGTAMFPAYDYHKLQLGVVYDVTPQWSVLAGGFTTLWGRNALNETGALLGAWYKF